jgi:hypothetical protein
MGPKARGTKGGFLRIRDFAGLDLTNIGNKGEKKG